VDAGARHRKVCPRTHAATNERDDDEGEDEDEDGV
jgi:hypothetical protein